MNYRSACQFLLLTISTILICACGHDPSDSSRPKEVIRVKTMKVSVAGVEENYTYSGTVEENSGTVISFSTAGTIKTLNVSEGQRIVKGQLIGTLDDNQLRNAYEIAKATLDQARDAYDRMKILHESNSLPDIKWVDVQSKLSQAESAAEIARIALDDTKLYAPVSGIVSEKMASVGQTVAPGVPVVKIIDINSVKVSISIPENEISALAIGTTAAITTNASAGKVYHGRLEEKGVSANALSRSYAAKFHVDNSEGALLPGMICEVAMDQGRASQGVLLPLRAVLLAADNSNFVWLDSAGVAVRRGISVSTMLPDGVMVTSGVCDGDMVIVEGAEKVSRGTKVKSIN